MKLAKALETSCAATGAALAAGVINDAQARAIVKAVTALPASVTEHDRRRVDAHLVSIAHEHDAADLALLGKKAFEILDPDAADEKLGKQLADEEREARRHTYLKLRDNGDGTVSGSFKIPGLHGAMLTKALEAFVAPRRVGAEGRRHTDGTPLNRTELLGMGLCELVERYPLSRVPRAGGANATVVVTMTLEQLTSGLGAAELDTGGHVSAGEARRLACAAGVIPAVLGGRSEVLDLGRRQRLHSPAQRLALTLRGRHCTEEHCRRPASWCPPQQALDRWRSHHRGRWPPALPVAPPPGSRRRLRPHHVAQRRRAVHPAAIGPASSSAASRRAGLPPRSRGRTTRRRTPRGCRHDGGRTGTPLTPAGSRGSTTSTANTLIAREPSTSSTTYAGPSP